jgi:hypothetical protein
MSRRSWLTLIVLGGVVIGLIALLFREATRGPIFRAGDYDNLQECLSNIPTEWPRGSVEFMGAEAACQYIHHQPLPRRG